MEKIAFKEIVELFLHVSFREIKREVETPNINFCFHDDVMSLFRNIQMNPFVKERYWTPNIEEEDIEYFNKHNNDDVITIQIHDSKKFFKYLRDITNTLIELNAYYGIQSTSRNLALGVMRRIWLRMGIDDALNVERFLERQLQFVKNRTFDRHGFSTVGSFNDYDVFMKTSVNKTWDETTRSMYFSIITHNKEYFFPHVLYDIDDNETCYIYAVQNSELEYDKKIERILYKLNKGIENPDVHPSKVFSLMLFISELKKKRITKIVVPSIQLLSYRYHELISDKVEDDLSEARMRLDECPDNLYFQKKYELVLEWYNNTHKNQDKISYLKTEELIHLLYRITLHDPSIEITNEINIQGDSMLIKIKKQII